MSLDSTVVVCAHNEEQYIQECLDSILAQTSKPSLVIVVADLCSDKTVEYSRNTLESNNYLIIEKSVRHWKNSISENLELARLKSSSEALVVVDADMIVPLDFMERLLPQLGRYSAVSALVRTDPRHGIVNKLVSIWERTYRIAPLGQQPRGGARAILKRDLDRVGGFRDVFAWESDLDNRLRKYGAKVKLDTTLLVLHRRKMSLSRSAAYQIQAGQARRELGVSAGRTLLHSLFRLRPFVAYGYFKGKEKSREGKS